MAKLKKRHRIRRKEVSRYASSLSEHFGCQVFSGSEVVDIAESDDHEIILVENVPVAVMIDGEPVLTVRGLMRYKPTRYFVEVDMGAVPFVTKGADVMAPGIVASDEVIKEGDLVWIRDERNKSIRKIRSIRTRKIGSPRTRLVTMASMASLAVWRDSTVLLIVS